MKKFQWVSVIFVLLGTLFLACSTVVPLLQGAKIQQPAVDFQEVKIAALSFDKVDLLFNIKIKNPNQIAIKLNGFDYNLSLNDSRFLSGKQDRKMELKALGETTIQLPLSLNFKDMYRTVRSLQSSDSSKYALECGFVFNLPILGSKRIPVRKSGDIPLLKIPSLKLHALRLKGLSLTRADLQLEIEVVNTNALPLSLGKLNYELDMNNARWLTGTSEMKKELKQKNKNILKLPLSLNLLELGNSVYQVIRGNKAFEYQLKGNMNLSSAKYLLPESVLPFDLTGKIHLEK